MHRKRMAAVLAACTILGALTALPAGAAQPWQTAYQTKLNALKKSDKNTRFTLVDVDRNGIPELITAAGDYHASSSVVYTYYNGTVTELGYGGDYGYFSYQPSLRRYVSTYSLNMVGGYCAIGYEIEGGTVREIYNTTAYAFYNIASDGVGEEAWFIGEERVTQEAYDRKMAEVGLGAAAEQYPRIVIGYGSMVAIDSTNMTKRMEAYRSPGDLTGDAAIDASDAARILMASAKSGATGSDGLNTFERTAGDVNGDLKMDASDAAIVLGYAAKAGTGWNGTLGEYLRER